MTEILGGNEADVQRAVAALRRGELVAFPTETVYGLGADASNEAAVRAVFLAKGRPSTHPLIVHLHAEADLGQWARPDGRADVLRDAFWPGPLTIILQRGPAASDIVTGNQDTVALRSPNHDLAQRLLAESTLALVGPSANRFGRVSPTTAGHVLQELSGRIHLILDGGPCRVGLESTIVDLSDTVPRVLRPGAISVAQLVEQLGVKVEAGAITDSPRVPGQLPSHYAPSASTSLLDGPGLSAWLPHAAISSGVIALDGPPADFPGSWITLPSDPEEYARELYASLRELDDTADFIVIQKPPSGAEWAAVNDRLERATATRELEGT